MCAKQGLSMHACCSLAGKQFIIRAMVGRSELVLLLLSLACMFLVQAGMGALVSQQQQVYVLFLLIVVAVVRGSKRAWCKLPRLGAVWELISNDSVNITVKERTIYWACRLNMGEFAELCDLLVPHLPSGRGHLPVRQAVALVLYRLAHNASVAEVGYQFGVGPATVSKYTKIICRALASEPLLSQGIVFPEDPQTVMGDFMALSGLPNVAGALDGKIFRLAHAPARRRYPHPEEFWCARKSMYGINVQGVVDAAGLFTFVQADFPGRTHDAFAFRACELYDGLMSGSMWGGGGQVADAGFQPVLAVDSGYPLLKCTVKRFHTHAHVGSRQEQAFDVAVSRARNPIERSWGRVCVRWEICKCLPVDVDLACAVVVGCLWLHNFVQRHRLVPGQEESDLEEEEEEAAGAGEESGEEEGEGGAAADAPIGRETSRYRREARQHRQQLLDWYTRSQQRGDHGR